MAIPRSLISFDPFELHRFLSQNNGESDTTPMPMDVVERGDSYLVHMIMPGVKKEDVHITIDGNQVSINAEIKAAPSEANDKNRILRQERFYGKLSRTFQLGSELDETKSMAKLSDGILELSLYKKQGEAAKQLTVQ